MSPELFLRTLALALAALLAPPAFAQDDDPAPKTDEAKNEAEAEKDEDEKDDAKKKDDDDDRVLAIVGADIETVTRGKIRRGTILIEGGRIAEVGQDVDVPEGAEVIDAAGKVVTPGFVATDMSGVGVGFNAGSRNNKVADSLDPFDRNLKFALGVGITSGAVQVGGSSRLRFFFEPDDGAGEPIAMDYDDLLALHDAGGLDDEAMDHLLSHAFEHEHEGEDLGVFAGDRGVSPYDERFFDAGTRDIACERCAATVIQVLPEPLAPPSPAKPRPDDYVVLKLTYGELDGMLVEGAPFYSLNASGLTGPFNVFSWREAIKEAREYLEAKQQYDADKAAGKKDIKEPRKAVDDKLLELVQGEIPLRTSALTVDQIRDQIALAGELDYDLVLEGAVEAWVIAEEVGEAEVPLIITPRVIGRYGPPEPGLEDESGPNVEMPGILQAAGIPFAVAPLGSYVSLGGLAGRDLTSLPLEAAFAVRGGASESTALAAITIVPARILGIDDRVGSIEEGKDADLLILDGDPLDYRTYVERAIVDGEVRYDRAEDAVYPVFDRGAR